MDRRSSSAITPQMYRHFATVTVMLTALVAFFANGESKQAMAAESSQQAAEQSAEKAEEHPQPAPTATPVNRGTWGNDDGGSFGRPMMSFAASYVSSWGGSDGWTPGSGTWQPDLTEPINLTPHQLTQSDHDQLSRALAHQALAGNAGGSTRTSDRSVEVVAVGR